MVLIMEKLSIVVKKIQAKEYIFLEKYPPPRFIYKNTTNIGGIFVWLFQEKVQ